MIGMRIGASTLFNPAAIEEAVAQLVSIGIKDIELCLVDSVPGVGKLKSLQKEAGLDYSIHAPFLLVDLAHPHPKIRTLSRDLVRQAIDMAAELKAFPLTVHPGQFAYESLLPKEQAFTDYRIATEEYLEHAMKSLLELSAYARTRGVKLCVENLVSGVGATHERVRWLLSEVDSLGFTLDIGHAHITGGLEAYQGLDPIHFHLHDNDGKEDDHLPLGEGNLDIISVLKRLKKSRGKLILELYSLEAISHSLHKLEEPDD
jgi:sugar phosphate isomerase/epimerase